MNVGIQSSLSRVGLGSARLGSGRLRLTIARVCELLETASEIGVNYIDTADSYCSGRSEEMLGEAMHQTRLSFTLMTKAGFTYVQLPRPLHPMNTLAQRLLHRLHYEENYHPPRIARCLDRSLRRLRCDRVDVFFLHRPSVGDVCNDNLLTALAGLKQAGKTLLLGLSSADDEVLQKGFETGLFQVLQTPVHAAISDGALHLIEAWAERRGPVIGHSVAARQSGGAHDMVRQAATSGAFAIAGHIQRALGTPGVSSVLTGTVSPTHLRANVSAAMEIEVPRP